MISIVIESFNFSVKWSGSLKVECSLLWPDVAMSLKMKKDHFMPDRQRQTEKSFRSCRSQKVFFSVNLSFSSHYSLLLEKEAFKSQL